RRADFDGVLVAGMAWCPSSSGEPTPRIEAAMSRCCWLSPLVVVALAVTAVSAGVREARAVAPRHDKVVVVIMENKSYDEARVQPYTASLLVQGATLTNSVAVTHPSQPNYFALWGANTLNIRNDNCPAPGSPFGTENLGQMCEAAGLTWRAYSEN